MRQCNNCENYVTEQFVRVFGNNAGEVNGCLECMDATAIKRGYHEPACGAVEDVRM